MADRYIDQDETQIYGPYAAKGIRLRVIGLIPAYDTALAYCADQLDLATAGVFDAVDAARSHDADARKGVQNKRPLLQQASSLLGKFSRHLGTHDEVSIDRRVFFTRDGTAKGAGKAAQDIVLAVTHIASKLDDPRSPVRDREHWGQRFREMVTALAPAVAFTDDARVDRQLATPEVEAARQVWLNTYIASKSLVESLLRHMGRLDQLSLFFYDLRVPSGAKVTAPPPDEPAVPAADEPDDDGDAD
jgi:hypothetical protein